MLSSGLGTCAAALSVADATAAGALVSEAVSPTSDGAGVTLVDGVGVIELAFFFFLFRGGRFFFSGFGGSIISSPNLLEAHSETDSPSSSMFLQ